MSDSETRVIRTPDQRLRVFVSSTLQEVSDERKAAREAITRLRLAPVMFELGARPHPPKELYRAYLDQSDIFVGVYWQKYGWVAPDMDISGLEDEWRLSGDKPKLIYIKAPALERDPRLKELLDRIRNDDRVSYKPFATPDELRELIENDLALLLTERFEITRRVEAAPVPAESKPRHNLPMQLTHFIGREKEVAAVKQLITAHRLVTLAGPGGAGKTRLSLQVAADMLEALAAEVWFVELAPLSDPALIAQTIATTLGVREEAGRSIGSTLTDYLRAKNVLLILDNCEHLVEACAQLADSLLRACPNLRLIASSREALGVGGEALFRVPPLATPDPRQLPPLDTLAQYEAVKLFIDRAAMAMPGFTLTDQNAAAVAQVCYRLDGIPLAIELAAARAKMLKVDQIAARLDDRFRLLTGGSRTALPRQQTLRAAIDWSYDLLAADERVVMLRLAVFVGGWTLEAAEVVCAGAGIEDYQILDALDSLLNKSMIGVDQEQDRAARYRMLNTIREYAQDKLREASESDPVHQHHVDFYLKLAETAEPELWRGRERAAWLDRLEMEHDNLRAALAWLQTKGDVESEMRLASALGQFWNERSHFREGRQWLEAGLAQRDRLSPMVLAHILRAAARLAGRQGDFDLAEARAQESVALLRERGDPIKLAQALNTLAAVVAEHGDVARSLTYNEEALVLYRELGDQRSIAQALSDVGWGAVFLGDYTRGIPLLEESLALERTLDDTVGIAWSALALGVARFLQGDSEAAGQLLNESLGLFGPLRNQWYIAGCLEGLAGVAGARRQYQRAAQLLGAHDRLVEVMGATIPVFWDRAIRQPLLADLHAQLDDAIFNAEQEIGRKMTLEEAMEYALGVSTNKQ